jgi:H+/Cl- antiporter ClcA
VNTLAGIAGAFAGVFSSPVVVVLLIMEVAHPGGQRFSRSLAASIVAGSVSFGIYFAIAGAVLLGAYQVPPYPFEDWQLLAAIPLGLFGALVTTLATGFLVLASWLFGRLKVPAIAKSALGGVAFGVVGVALPLTMFSGDDQLHSVLDGAGTTLGLGLLVAVLIAKMLTYAVSQGSGFVGGPLFPALFLGGTAGVIVHQAIPGVPLGLAFTCLLPAVLGTLAAAPFSMVLLTALMTRVGAPQTAPILIAVATAFLAMQGMRYLLASRRQARTAAGANDSTQELVCVNAGRARFACLEPRLAVGQVFLSRAPVEDLFESSNDPAGIGLGAAVAARHEDHAEVASPAGCYRLVVLSAGERQDLGI